MITALISAGFGALNALLPDVVGYFKRKQEMAERAAERTHELAMIGKQVDAQIRIGQQKIEEIRTAGDIELVRTEVVGQFDQLKAIYAQQAPIGVKWVDAWNSALRPMACTMILVIFAFICACVMYSAILKLVNGTATPEQVAAALLTGIIGESIQAILGYLFGYRGTNAARKFSGA